VSVWDYEYVLTQLATCGVIDAALRERFRGLGGFRNLLVHGYLKLDANRVAQVLADAPERFSARARDRVASTRFGASASNRACRDAGPG
jgi:uncharacterized protein YutE (UPF0331/DUF86 family)